MTREEIGAAILRVLAVAVESCWEEIEKLGD